MRIHKRTQNRNDEDAYPYAKQYLLNSNIPFCLVQLCVFFVFFFVFFFAVDVTNSHKL